MWLAETAVDMETLETLAEHGIQVHHPFALSGRPRAQDWRTHWEDVSGGRIDPTRAYLASCLQEKASTYFSMTAPFPAPWPLNTC